MLDEKIVTPEQEAKKQCPKCHEVKPFSKFSANRNSPDGRDHFCKECKKIYQRQYRANTQVKAIEKLNLPIEGEKLCTKCNEMKPLSEFFRNRYGKDGFHHHCKACFQEWSKSYKKVHPPPPYSRPESEKEWSKRFKEAHGYSYHSASGVRRKYGLTIEDYERMLEAQGSCCAICGVSQSELNRRLHVDHDHATGKVRALLCHTCNLTIGYIENAFSIDSYISYLQVHGSFCSAESNTDGNTL